MLDTYNLVHFTKEFALLIFFRLTAHLNVVSSEFHNFCTMKFKTISFIFSVLLLTCFKQMFQQNLSVQSDSCGLSKNLKYARKTETKNDSGAGLLIDFRMFLKYKVKHSLVCNFLCHVKLSFCGY